MDTSYILDGSIAIATAMNFPDRPTIVFLHDSLGCTELWRGFPQKLGQAANCDIILYDRQGYGMSAPFNSPRANDYLEKEADVLAQIIEILEMKEAILFGHSDGGSISLLAAAKYPTKIAAVITEGAHIFVEEETLRGINEAIHLYQATNLKQKLQRFHGDKTEEMFWAWAATWTSESFRKWNIENFLPAVACPSLVIQGEADEFGSLQQVDGIMNQVSGKATKLIVPNAKHTPHKEMEQLVLESAAEFILRLFPE